MNSIKEHQSEVSKDLELADAIRKGELLQCLIKMQDIETFDAHLKQLVSFSGPNLHAILINAMNKVI